MIERYSRPEMSRIWTDENKFQKMLDVEILACEAFAKLGQIPKEAVKIIENKARFSVQRIKEIEETTNHDVVAFIKNISENVGNDAKYFHFGLTSSDVLDTALSIQMVEASDLLLSDIDQLIKTVGKLAVKYKNTMML